MSRNRGLRVAVIAVLVIAGYFLLFRQEPEKPASGAVMVQVSVPLLNGAASEGERVFNDYCAACHGRKAAGQEGIAPPLIYRIYEPSHHADGSFFLAVRQGVRAHHWPFGNMPPVEGLTDRQVEQIVAYIRVLQRTNGIQ
ncbi:c-type cytochrome [Roseibium sp. M-1]